MDLDELDKKNREAAMTNRRKLGLHLDEVVDGHLDGLRSEDPSDREHSARALAHMGPQVYDNDRKSEILNTLHDTVQNDPKEQVRFASSWALGEIRLLGSIPVLREVAEQDPSAWVRTRAAEDLHNVMTQSNEHFDPERER